jgi:hypothetical protein
LFVAAVAAVIVTVAGALTTELFANEDAVFVTEPPDGIAGGAVNTLVAPLGVLLGLKENDPHATAGVQAQSTPAFVGSLVTAATTLPLELTARVVGAIEIVTVIGFLLLLPQPALLHAKSATKAIQRVPRFIAGLPSLRTS